MMTSDFQSFQWSLLKLWSDSSAEDHKASEAAGVWEEYTQVADTLRGTAITLIEDAMEPLPSQWCVLNVLPLVHALVNM